MKKISKKVAGILVLTTLISSNSVYAQETVSTAQEPEEVLTNQEVINLEQELNQGNYEVDMDNVEITYHDDNIIIGNLKDVNYDWMKGFYNSKTTVTKNVINNTSSNGFPGVTATGNGGYAKLDNFGGRGRALRWAVKPNTGWPFIFNGTIKLRYYSGFKRDATVRGGGALYSEASGFIYMNANNGGKATLEGVAESMDQRAFFVAPNVSVAF